MINHVNMIESHLRKMTSAIVTIDSDFDRQIHRGIIILITCGRLNVLFIDRARHNSLVLPGNCIAERHVRVKTLQYADFYADICPPFEALLAWKRGCQIVTG